MLVATVPHNSRKCCNAIYEALGQAYEQHGYPQAIRQHHQVGTTGYLSREILANPTTSENLVENTVVAWSPSLPGAKIEDTFIILKDGELENLTFDPNWPSVKVAGRNRPFPLEITPLLSLSENICLF